jgi:DNA-binding NarL/FixJ family response regulator
MAVVLVLSADLMFGSRVQAQLAADGHEPELIGGVERLRERLADGHARVAELLIVDLTDDRLDGAAAVQTLAADGALAGTRTLAFYSHVDADTRARAQRAGFDLVVPRSRMAREGAQLVRGLL